MPKKNFTLIELLVIIAIICLLLALLMPSISRAREMGKRVLCQGNLKQIALKTNLYLGESRGFFPCIPGYAGQVTFPCQLMGLPPNSNLLAKYKMFQCPSFLPSGWYETSFPWRYAYLFNRDMLGNGSGTGTQTTKVTRPAAKMLQMDFCSFGLNHYYRNLNNNTAATGLQCWVPGSGSLVPEVKSKVALIDPSLFQRRDFTHGRHLITVNVLFIDGHLEVRNSGSTARDLHMLGTWNAADSIFNPLQ